MPASSLKTKPAKVEADMLQPNDTCDKCGPGIPANTAVKLRTGTLTFCNHCYATYELALMPVTLLIQRNTVK